MLPAGPNGPGRPSRAAGWTVLRDEDGVTDYLAAIVPLELHATEVDSYRTSLMMTPPSVFVVLDTGVNVDNAHGIDVHVVTASADIAGDYTDSAEVLVEPVAMPDGLIGTVRDFCEGDPRIRQTSDVYRAPGSLKPGKLS